MHPNANVQIGGPFHNVVQCSQAGRISSRIRIGTVVQQELDHRSEIDPVEVVKVELAAGVRYRSVTLVDRLGERWPLRQRGLKTRPARPCFVLLTCQNTSVQRKAVGGKKALCTWTPSKRSLRMDLKKVSRASNHASTGISAIFPAAPVRCAGLTASAYRPWCTIGPYAYACCAAYVMALLMRIMPEIHTYSYVHILIFLFLR